MGKWRDTIGLRLNKISLSNWFVALVALSVLFYVLMNLFAMRPIGWNDFMLANAGLLLIVPVLALQNVITEVWGQKTALRVTFFSIGCQIVVVLFAELIILLPTNNPDASAHWASVFGSQWRVALASITAFIVGSFLNIVFFAKIREQSKKAKSSYKWLYLVAAFVSTVIAQFIDSTIFMILAFAPTGGVINTFELGWNDIWTSVAIGTSVQVFLEATLVVVVCMHLAKWLKEKRERQESIV